MTWYDEYDLPERLEAHLDDIIGNDTHLADLFDAAMFDDIHGSHFGAAMDELQGYLLEEYGYDLMEDFDWQDWRDWYASA